MESFCELRRQAAIDDLLAAGWIQHLEWPLEVDSTNNLAKLHVQQLEMQVDCDGNVNFAPALFVADRQTAGRGRSGNAWWSPDGCLMFTLLISTDELPDAPERYPQLALVAGLALGETVDHFLGPGRSQLKWPNDVYVADKKLAGILIESIPRQVQSIVFAIGIGVNTAIEWQLAPDAIRQHAICLSTAANRAIHRESVLVEFIPRFAEHLRAWREDSDHWRTEWQKKNLLHGRIVTVQIGESQVVGLCEGIDSMGRLLLRSERELRKIAAGSIHSWQ